VARALLPARLSVKQPRSRLRRHTRSRRIHHVARALLPARLSAKQPRSRLRRHTPSRRIHHVARALLPARFCVREPAPSRQTSVQVCPVLAISRSAHSLKAVPPTRPPRWRRPSTRHSRLPAAP